MIVNIKILITLSSDRVKARINISCLFSRFLSTFKDPHKKIKLISHLTNIIIVFKLDWVLEKQHLNCGPPKKNVKFRTLTTEQCVILSVEKLHLKKK